MTPPNPAPASRVRSALAPLRREFANNIRVRFGVWCVLAMVLLYWILVRSEDLQAARAEYAGEIARLERAQEARADEDWPLLLEVEQRTGAELNANFWQAETEGVAQARLLAALTELAGETELREARVQPGVVQPVADAPDVWRVQARLTARHRMGAELRLLHAFATHPKKLVVDRLDISQTRARINILVSAYFVGLAPDARMTLPRRAQRDDLDLRICSRTASVFGSPFARLNPGVAFLLSELLYLAISPRGLTAHGARVRRHFLRKKGRFLTRGKDQCPLLAPTFPGYVPTIRRPPPRRSPPSPSPTILPVCIRDQRSRPPFAHSRVPNIPS